MRKKVSKDDLPWYQRTTLQDIAAVFRAAEYKPSRWRARGCPGLQNSPYDLREIIPWYIENVYIPAKSSVDRRVSTEGVDTAPAIEKLKLRKIEQEIRQADLKFAIQCRQMVPVKFVEDIFHQGMAHDLQRAGENLRVHHGDEAQKILHDALKAMSAKLDGMWREYDLAADFQEERKPTGEQKPRPKKKKS